MLRSWKVPSHSCTRTRARHHTNRILGTFFAKDFEYPRCTVDYVRHHTLSSRFFSISVDNHDTIRIGHVERKILSHNLDSKTDVSSNLVPSGYLPTDWNLSQSTLAHLQWMMAKDNLKQDMLLVGAPGAGSVDKLRLALMYAELTKQQVEVLTLSYDITESDLKQRREIVSHTPADSMSQEDTSPVVQIKFVDQQPVRAATKGRILILDGLEKVERNVLPTLNNLLENREMHLEDGRLLVSSERYEMLQKDVGGGVHLDKGSFLTPTHPNFRVIACCAYNGRALDPPLRSRFQIRRVDPPSLEDTFQMTLQSLSQDNDRDQALQVAKLSSTFANTIGDIASNQSKSSTYARVLHFPLNHVVPNAHLLSIFPLESPSFLLQRSYPPGTQDERMKHVMLKYFHESHQAFEDVSKELKLQPVKGVGAKGLSAYEVETVEPVSNVTDGLDCHANVTFSSISTTGGKFLSDMDNSTTVTVTVQCGGREAKSVSNDLVKTDGVKSVLSSMIQEHYIGRDILLLSPRGEGKSTIAAEFASVLGYEEMIFPLHKDMTSRDLLMRRMTNQAGETTWGDSPLVQAARSGQICILDGVEKLNSDTLATLKSLMIDREIWLPDGSRLAKKRLSSQSSNDGMIHPSFRVIALGSLSGSAESRPSWLNEDLFSMFASIPIPAYTRSCLQEILYKNRDRYGSTYTNNDIDTILNFHESFIKDDELGIDCGIKPPSTRNLLRLVRRGATSSCLHDNICSLFAIELLPPSQRESFDALLERLEITGQYQRSKGDYFGMNTSLVTLTNKEANVAGFQMERQVAQSPGLVPSPHFFDIPNHVETMKTLLSDWARGERFFLILGNQGVGKNKVVDRLCQIANFEREYLQLHRDSTVGQLTLSPTLDNGKIVWKDSPLVRAVTEGRSLVIDEADKAPAEVLYVLKSLVADGNLLLADGRRISKESNQNDPDTIAIHPDFTLFILANRPGFPFHGNSLMDSIADCFQIQVIPNPDLESEVELLQSYAPNVKRKILKRIALSFAELRSLFENGTVQYPYSTREAVAVAKHVNEYYPNDSIVKILHNVLDFDSFDKDVYRQICKVFHDHGFNFQAELESSKFEELKLEYRGEEGKSLNPPQLGGPKIGKWDDANEAHVGGNQWAGGTGGSDTAGLGGRGGPYRLDRGHKVHQVSEEAKAEVSKEAREAARKIAEKALAERLAEIGMSNDEYELYENFLKPIKSDIKNLQAVLKRTEVQTNKIDWIKNQSQGELDDSKLVEGLSGEKHVFKRRNRSDPEWNSAPKMPKRLRFVMDVSGSMYRFNGYDERLNRCLEATALIMECFDGLGERFDYSIVGHSGDSPCIEFSDFGSPPSNAKTRMSILQKMVAHSQFCQSGDYTLEAIRLAMKDVKPEDSSGDQNSDSLVIVISDANLARYGIRPRELRYAIDDTNPDSRIKCHCVFIASFGSEAEEIKRSLPVGRGHVASNTSDLINIVRNILSAGL